MIARLQKKVAGNKKIVNDITEMAILAFDQRDEAQSKITGYFFNFKITQKTIRFLINFNINLQHCKTEMKKMPNNMQLN